MPLAVSRLNVNCTRKLWCHFADVLVLRAASVVFHFVFLARWIKYVLKYLVGTWFLLLLLFDFVSLFFSARLLTLILSNASFLSVGSFMVFVIQVL